MSAIIAMSAIAIVGCVLVFGAWVVKARRLHPGR
jgi:hypothetical protein